MAVTRRKRTYHHLVIRAPEPATVLWLCDVDGHLVQKETGVLDTHLLPGDYAVEFGLGTTQYPIYLQADSRFTEAELKQGPTCDYRFTDLDNEIEDEPANVHYYMNKQGSWIRREWKPQCLEEVFIYGRCQGVLGHDGIHWCYSSSGDYIWAENERERIWDEAAAGEIPPGHNDYVAPVEMQRHYYLSHYDETEVTDRDIIEMLKKGKAPEPCTSVDGPFEME